MMEDEKIIELYLSRSEEAIPKTEEKFGKFCLSIAKNILGNEEDAKECLNDTLLALWNSIPPKRPENLSAFAGKISRNIALNNFRRKNAGKRGACFRRFRRGCTSVPRSGYRAFPYARRRTS